MSSLKWMKLIKQKQRKKTERKKNFKRGKQLRDEMITYEMKETEKVEHLKEKETLRIKQHFS